MYVSVPPRSYQDINAIQFGSFNVFCEIQLDEWQRNSFHASRVPARMAREGRESGGFDELLCWSWQVYVQRTEEGSRIPESRGQGSVTLSRNTSGSTSVLYIRWLRITLFLSLSIPFHEYTLYNAVAMQRSNFILSDVLSVGSRTDRWTGREEEKGRTRLVEFNGKRRDELMTATT